MIKQIWFLLLLIFPGIIEAQSRMTPELLLKLGRVSGQGISKDGKHLVYSVTQPDIESNKSARKTFIIPVDGGNPTEITDLKDLLNDKNLSPDKKYLLSHRGVKLKKISGSDFYPELSKSNAYIYDDLMYRHWDTWEDGIFDHVFVSAVDNSDSAKDIMAGEPFNSPTKPFGGDEDYIWHPGSKSVIYVTKKKSGKEYAQSTNTDLYSYDLASGKTENLTSNNPGYDVHPLFSSNGVLAWLQMKRDGYESDKQDLVVQGTNGTVNLTAHRDDIHVLGFIWSRDGNSIYFNAPINGTIQLFSVAFSNLSTSPEIKQITTGDFDVTGMIGQVGNKILLTRTDINRAAEIYSVDLADGSMKQLTHVNDEIYSQIASCSTERRFVRTTDKQQMLVWVVYPPNFDPNKKYPTLLYCQGGPQSPLTQFYSFRWNLQLMASQGYIVVAPNRRGMPGHGTKWNEQISKDHGGQVMKDYLSAIDALSKDKYVDTDRLGAVGASYGGYSVFMLAGIHKNRFKSFIAHDGIFDMRSMYGTTEELFFVNWDWGGPYWDLKNKAAKKNYSKFNPINLVEKWNTPILIVQGGKDYRVPVEQGLQAFQAAQLLGIKSKLLFLPEENHWVLGAQNSLVWQREFFKWLEETLPSKGF